MSDKGTLAVYAAAAGEYAKRFARVAESDVDQFSDLAAFFELLPDNGLVLDLGCGPGQWAAKIREAGYRVEGMDASPEMAALAKERFDLDVTVGVFEDLDASGVFDGIWANFSLLHAPKAAMPEHLNRIHRALKPSGAFHIGTKLGEGEDRDHLGRFYSYYQAEELTVLLEEAGFTVVRKRTGSAVGLAGSKDTFVILTAHG
ncbi:class I SAM-dependent methyltransferase [Shimia sp.]|jgi:SAM-dependent methyltransferase|uniref:class I SAM-dependent methyltransferase n=1 Tax=unclassified Shimia TaxID=2630038 RepID=UPI0025D17B22|nr:class I SAM-dependent methyltransferase [Shimia sp.]MCH2068062.1 class I SAM-dependent methyltransferase [Shimia sp.]